MRKLLVIALSMSFLTCTDRPSTAAKDDLSKFAGKYEVNNVVIQVAVVGEKLAMYVPGAPVQELKNVGLNKYKSTSFDDEVFSFVEQNGKVVEMVSDRNKQSTTLKKISDTPDNFNQNDSLLTLKKSTAHFSFLYTAIDSLSIELIASKLEANYKKITSDFKIDKIPATTVRIYPDLQSFHRGINFPNAPAEILATAFGRDDIRMASPNATGVDSATLMKGVTHEFTHCVHLNIDYAPNNPRWLWEGVAMYEADWTFDPGEVYTMTNNKFPSLDSLGNGLEYMLGFVIIEAIIDQWGFDTVIELIKKRGDIQAVLKTDQQAFEKIIYDRIYEKYIKKVK
jgi:hypothetical protein